MKSNQQVNLTNDEISKVVTLLNDIDSKIADLHQISSKDFLGFNDLLKEYHQKVKNTVKETGELFDFLINIDGFFLVKRATILHQLSKNKVQTIHQATIGVSEILKKTQENISQFFVPYNNFRQNLMTLKFLFTNVKLTMWISDPVRAGEINELIDQITSSIQNTKDGLPALDVDMQQLNRQLGAMMDPIQKLFNQKLYEIENHTILVGTYLQEIQKLKNSSIENNKKVEQYKQQCFKNLDNIVTNLQYHDIIRQKMEHIQITHKNIIDNLNSITHGVKTEITSHEYIKQIPEVAEIQSAQLMFTNKEYQNAIENITQKLYETEGDLNQIIDIYNSKTSYISDFENLINKLSVSCDKLHQLFEQIEELVGSLNTEATQYQMKVEEQIIRKDNLQQIEDKLVELLDKTKQIKGSDGVQADIFSKQIEPLLSDIHNSRLRMENLIPDTKKLSFKTNVEHLSSTVTKLTNNLVNLNTEIDAEIINKIKTGKELITNKQLVNSNGYMQSIERVVYYEVFDREVENIINSLNEIYLLLVPFNDSTKTPKDLLNNMEVLYTMQTQRDLHINKNNHFQEEDKESDLELF